MAIEITKSQKVKGIVFLIVLMLGGSLYSWGYDRDYNTFYNDGTIEARSNWEVHMERTYFKIKYNYQRDNCLRDGGRLTATRCYYPDDFYVKLTRKLSSIDLKELKFDKYSTFSRDTSYNKYGTSGVSAGTLIENMVHDYEVTDIEEFPQKYIVEYNPKDTAKYKLALKVDLLKDMNLEVGTYTETDYVFGRIKIGVPVEYFDYMEVIDDDTIKFWFLPKSGLQALDIELVDPLPIKDISEIIVKPILWEYIYENKSIQTPIYTDKIITVKPVCSEVLNIENITYTLNTTNPDNITNITHITYLPSTVCTEAYNYTEKELTSYTTEYYPAEKLGIRVKDIDYLGYVNIKDDTLSKWSVPIGDRNFVEFGRCRPYEIAKGVCTEESII